MCEYENPGGGAVDGGFEVLGEPAAAIDPGKMCPTPRRPGSGTEAMRVLEALDDFDGTAATLGHRVAQLAAMVGTVGEEVSQQRGE